MVAVVVEVVKYMIYSFFQQFIDLVMGSHTFNLEVSYIMASFFPICILYALLVPVFGKSSCKVIVYILLIFIAVLLLNQSGGLFNGL